MSSQEFLQAARRLATTCVENAKQQYAITLDYSLVSLMLVPMVTKKYHEVYQKAATAKDPEVNKFLQQASFEITSYVGEVYVRHCGATWITGAKGEIYLKVGAQQFPLHRQVLEDIVQDRHNVLTMISKVAKAVEQAPPMLQDPPTAQPLSAPAPPPPPPPPVDSALQETMRKCAERGVQVAAENFNMKLDYQWQTLATMDEVVDSFHRYVVAKGSDQEFVRSATLIYGAYVGEVVRGTHGGHWVQDSPQQYAWLWTSGARFDILLRIHQRIANGTLPTLRSYWDEVRAEAHSSRTGQQQYDSAALKQEMKQAANVAVQDVKATLKRDLDFTPASLPILQDALVRVRVMIDAAPEHKSAIVNASLKKYGAYLGEVILADRGGMWCKNVDKLAPDQPALSLGTMYAVPQHMILAVLEGKSLHMGGLAEPASTVVDYFNSCRRLQDEWILKILNNGQTQESVLREISDDSNIAIDVYNLTAQALLTANTKWDLKLDLSPASIEGLEDLLTKLWDINRSAGPEDKPTQQQIGGAVVIWGAYLGEVIRRSVGGKWVATSGPPAHSILQITSEEVVDPLVKVNGRLFNGTEDNIHYYFKKLVEHFRPEATERTAPAPPVDEQLLGAGAIGSAAQSGSPPGSVSLPPQPSPPPPEEIEIGGPEIIELQQQVRSGDLTGFRQAIARLRENSEWQDRLFVIRRVIPRCQLHVLDQACEAEPQAADVFLLRCALFSHLAGEARGKRTVEQTSDAQFGTAGRWLKEALREYERASELDRADPTLHAIIMPPLVIFGDMRERLRDAYFKATRLAPNFLSPHLVMVNAESERWGGSHDKSLHIARGAMLGAPGDSAVCLFWAHILVWTHILAFDRDQPRAQSYRKSPGILKELAQAFDAWTGESYQPRRSSVLYFHYPAFWFYVAGDRERLRKALAYTKGIFCESPWEMIGKAREVHAKAVQAAGDSITPSAR